MININVSLVNSYQNYDGFYSFFYDKYATIYGISEVKRHL